jgi:hypothetical protein
MSAKKLYNEKKYGSLDDECEFQQGDFIGRCSEFIATKFKASMYILTI